MEKHNKSMYEIPLAEAKELTAAWAAQGNLIKAFLVDAQELKDMLEEDGVKYIRMYFGWDNSMEDGRQQRMIMVPADIYGQDMVNKNVGTDLKGPVDSNVFDFTMPCPPTCSPDEF
ncbi:hypothetical protein AQ505_04855 [Pedobacter sp. PACM 27299]|uniref:hypothetical protein n=1 Tax=Pedobacter sp. PACM 27299 TaxID=1727164 RepID=UPI0007058E85|nr:hypothetical protein [Pedobacter sp. PACM 27299]ALL04876.1 hypothetical protein AQ505_04855 [Pedobacter sp. PACM 27299]